MLLTLALFPFLILGTCAWSGILLDSRNPQLYLPTSSPHTIGNISFKLPNCFGTETAVMLNGLVYFISGDDCPPYHRYITYIFDPQTNVTVKSHAKTPYTDFMVSTVVNGTIVLCSATGDFACYTYSVSAQTWTDVTQLDVSHPSGFALTTINNEVYVFGGGGDIYGCYDATSNSYKYDNKWQKIPLAPMPQATSGHSALTLSNSTALICGGFINITNTTIPSCAATSNCFVYTASTDSWMPVKSMATARAGASMVTFDGRTVSVLIQIHSNFCIQVVYTS